MKWSLLATCLMLVPAVAEDAPEHPVEIRATAEDCAIFAELGKAKLQWTATAAPDGIYAGETTEYDDGHKPRMSSDKPDRHYTAECHWGDFDLAEPVKQNAWRSYAFGRPNYLGQDRAMATWSATTVAMKDGKPTFDTTVELCTLLHPGVKWLILSCRSLTAYIPDDPPKQK